MSAGLAISSFMPSIISSSVFSTRRANSGAEAIASSNPCVGMINMDIAGGQLVNAAKGTSELIKNSNSTFAKGFTSAEQSIKALTKSDKLINGIGKVVKFTADNINPIICAKSTIDVLTTDENKVGYTKEQAAIDEGSALATMFGCEKLAKKILGMPKNYTINDSIKVINDDLYKINKDGSRKLLAKKENFILGNNRAIVTIKGLYKNNEFLSKHSDSFKNYCDKNKLMGKSLKFLPGALKGLGFVTASITGYQLGSKIGSSISGTDKIKD